MALEPKSKLRIACALLAASMLVVSFQWRWHELQPIDPIVFIIAFITWGLCLWGAFGGRAAWVVLLIRAVVQVGVMGLAVAAIQSRGSSADVFRGQAVLSLGLTLWSLAWLLSRPVRGLMWGARGDAGPAVARPASRLGTRGVLVGLAVVSGIAGTVEQAWVYQHLSALEVILRSLYVGLPWAGAWLLARVGRDRIALTTLGALLGELASDLLSMVASGADVSTVFLRLMLPAGCLPAVFVGLALGVFGPRRPLWQLGLVLPLAQLAYRAAAEKIARPDASLYWQLEVLAIVVALCYSAVVYRFRRVDPTPESVPAG